MSVVYIPNPDFPDEAVRATFVKVLLEELGKAGAELYRDGVPVDESDLRNGIFFDVQMTSDGFVGRIGSTDWKAALIEFGTSLHAPDGSLRQAIEGIGLTFEEVRGG